MRAIVISQAGDPSVLQLRDLPIPEPGRGEVRVRVRATAVNRADVLQRKGLYPAPPGVPKDIPGLEFAGEVDAAGDGVELAPGERVFGLAGGGTYAEFLIAHERTLVPIPQALSFCEATAIPEAFVTAYDAMVKQAGLSAGETVLVHAAGSGVGTAAVQIARAVGARPIGTARTARKLEQARALGMADGVLVQGGEFAAAVQRIAGKDGVQIVLELVGGSYLGEDLQCVAPRGRIMVVGLMAGARAELDLATLLRKRLVVCGTVLRSRPLEEKIEAAKVLARHLAPLFASGTLRPIIDRVFPLASAAAAHAYVESNQTFGKVVLEL